MPNRLILTNSLGDVSRYYCEIEVNTDTVLYVIVESIIMVCPFLILTDISNILNLISRRQYFSLSFSVTTQQ